MYRFNTRMPILPMDPSWWDRVKMRGFLLLEPSRQEGVYWLKKIREVLWK